MLYGVTYLFFVLFGFFEKNLSGKLLTYDGTKATYSLKQSQCLKTFVFILSVICQERAKRSVVISVKYKTEDSYITHQLKTSDSVEEDCLEGVCQ